MKSSDMRALVRDCRGLIMYYVSANPKFRGMYNDLIQVKSRMIERIKDLEESNP